MADTTTRAKPKGRAGVVAGALSRAAGKSPDIERRVSTRFPTAAKATENPIEQQLSIGLPEMEVSPTFADNVSLLPTYPGFARLADLPPGEAAREYVDQARGNLNFLYESSPDVVRQRSPHWYDGANAFSERLANKYGIGTPSSSGAIAALSPQKDWFQNASLAERVGDVVFGAPSGMRRMSPEMMDRAKALGAGNNSAAETARKISGKPFSKMETPEEQALWIRLYDEAHNPRRYRAMNPEGDLGDFVVTNSGKTRDVAWGSMNEISKAVRSYLSGDDMRVISPLLGERHKVRNFYNNIEVPNLRDFGDVTADTHQVAAAQLRPLSGNSEAVMHNLATSPLAADKPEGWRAARSSAVDGVQGTYGLVAEATRNAARDQGLLPRQMQSATWEPVRELYTDVSKRNPRFVQSIDDVWRAFDRGEIDLDTARRTVLELGGGIREPGWARPGFAPMTPHASTYRARGGEINLEEILRERKSAEMRARKPRGALNHIKRRRAA